MSLAVACAAAPAAAAPDAAPAGAYVADGPVYALARANDTLYMGGSFTQVGPRTGPAVVLEAGGQGHRAAAFPEVTGGEAYILTAIADGAGGWFIGGSFRRVGGLPRANLAHVLAAGTVDPEWRPDPNGKVRTLLRAGDSVFVGGDFTTIGGLARARIAKLSATAPGTVDPTWNPSATNSVETMVLSADRASLFVGGGFSNISGVTRNGVAKIAVSGTGAADATWNPNANAAVAALVLSKDGTSLFAGGDFTTIGGITRKALAKLSAGGTGAGDATWSAGVVGYWVSTLALSGDGAALYVGGFFTNVGSAARRNIGRISTATGTADTWDPSPNNDVWTITPSNDGASVYVGGNFTSIGGLDRRYVAKIASAGSGTALSDWDANANSGAATFVPSPDGATVLSAGAFTSVGGQVRRNLAAIDLRTGRPTDWDPGTNAPVQALALAKSTGAVYAGGQFSMAGGLARAHLAKIGAGGTVDPQWNPGANNTVLALALSPDETALYAGGRFSGATAVGGAARDRVAKLSTTGAGAVNQTWAPAINNAVHTLALSADGAALFAGGEFTVAGGQTRNRLAKLATTGTGQVDLTWMPSANKTVEDLVVSPDGASLFAGGEFTLVNSTIRNRLAKLTTSLQGTLDQSWDPNANEQVFTVELSADGSSVFVGGLFTTVGGQTRGRIAKLGASGAGAVDPGWDPDAEGAVQALLSLPDGSLVAGGGFRGFDRAAASMVAYFGIAPAVTAAPAGVAVTAGEGASFTAAFSGVPVPAVQWQVSSDGGATYADVAGETGSTLTLPSTSVAQDGSRYRAVATSIAGTAVTEAATLSVSAPRPDTGSSGAVNGGSSGSTDTPPPVVGAPSLTGVRQSHARWRRGNRLAHVSGARKRPPVGTTFRFRLDQQARVTFRFVQQRGRGVVARGTLRFDARAGGRSVAFRGRLSKQRRLAPGRYTVVITAVNAAGKRSAARRLRFTIVG